jgi:hypothetical protein
MTKQQIAVIRESIKISPRVALSQFREFSKEDKDRVARARRDARLVTIFN